MTTIKSFLRRSGLPVRGEAAWREVEDELRFHIEMRARDNIAAGMSPEDAVADAMRRFGNYDHIRKSCEEIRRERMALFMKLVKAFCWILLGCGLTLEITSQLGAVRLVGQFLTIIASLWLLLIYLREKRLDQRHIVTAEQQTLSVINAIGDFPETDFAEDPPRPVPSYDKDGRTPVERLLSDGNSDE
jgi:hypothetical protein